LVESESYVPERGFSWVKARRRHAVHELPRLDESRLIDDIVESSGLNSGEILATLFHLEIRGIVRQSLVTVQ
jgi:hypothetical protein